MAELLLLLEKAELKIKDLEKMLKEFTKDGVPTETGNFRKSIAFMKKQEESDDDNTPMKRPERIPAHTTEVDIGCDGIFSPLRSDFTTCEIQTFDPERDIKAMETQTSRLYKEL